MKPVIIIAIAFVLFIPASVFAETFEVRILEGSSTEGCEITDSCLSPSNLDIVIGDSVNWIREEDTTHFLVSRTSEGQLEWSTMGYSHTFNHARYYDYTISEMPWVSGVINVQYTQSLDGIPNNIKFTNAEKIDTSLHLDYEGHLDTSSGVLHVFAESEQLIVNIGVSATEDGSFSHKLIDVDDAYWEWVTGDYRTEFWSVNGDNGNKKSEIIHSSFTLNLKTESILESTPEAVELSEPIPEWVRSVFIFWANGNISDDELKNAIKFLVESGIIKIDD